LIANSQQPGHYAKYYAGLKADFNRASILGLRSAYPSDYATLKSQIAKNSPARWAKVDEKAADDDARYTSQAEADLAALTARFPADGWQNVTSVTVKSQWTYQYVVESVFWNSLPEVSRDDLKSGLKGLAENSYEKSHCGNKPPYEVGLSLFLVDENGVSLAAESPQPEPTPFMQAPAPRAPCSQ
jgi:hypothetical protein